MLSTELGPQLTTLGVPILRLVIGSFVEDTATSFECNIHPIQDKGVESIGGGKNAFIGNHGTTWVPVDWNVSFLGQ